MLKKKKSILFASVFICILIFSWIASPVRIVHVNSKLIFVEIARTQAQRQKGLQNRSYLKKNHGMLFVFKEEGFHTFWMKDTYIPLDIAFIDRNNTIVDIQQMIPLNTQIRYNPVKKVKYALEVNAGWMEENNIHVNEKVFFW